MPSFLEILAMLMQFLLSIPAMLVLLPVVVTAVGTVAINILPVAAMIRSFSEADLASPLGTGLPDVTTTTTFAIRIPDERGTIFLLLVMSMVAFAAILTEAWKMAPAFHTLIVAPFTGFDDEGDDLSNDSARSPKSHLSGLSGHAASSATAARMPSFSGLSTLLGYFLVVVSALVTGIRSALKGGAGYFLSSSWAVIAVLRVLGGHFLSAPPSLAAGIRFLAKKGAGHFLSSFWTVMAALHHGLTSLSSAIATTATFVATSRIGTSLTQGCHAFVSFDWGRTTAALYFCLAFAFLVNLPFLPLVLLGHVLTMVRLLLVQFRAYMASKAREWWSEVRQMPKRAATGLLTLLTSAEFWASVLRVLQVFADWLQDAATIFGLPQGAQWIRGSCLECIDRWHGVPQAITENGQLRRRVQELAATVHSLSERITSQEVDYQTLQADAVRHEREVSRAYLDAELAFKDGEIREGEEDVRQERVLRAKESARRQTAERAQHEAEAALTASQGTQRQQAKLVEDLTERLGNTESVTKDQLVGRTTALESELAAQKTSEAKLTHDHAASVQDLTVRIGELTASLAESVDARTFLQRDLDLAREAMRSRTSKVTGERDQAHARLAALEEQAADAQTTCSKVAGERDQAEAKLVTLQTHVADAQTGYEDMAKAIEALRAERDEANSKVAGLEAWQTAASEEYWRVSRERDAAIERAAAADKRAAAADERAVEVEERVVAATQHAVFTNKRAEAAYERADAAEERADAAEKSADAANERADASDRQASGVALQRLRERAPSAPDATRADDDAGSGTAEEESSEEGGETPSGKTQAELDAELDGDLLGSDDSSELSVSYSIRSSEIEFGSDRGDGNAEDSDPEGNWAAAAVEASEALGIPPPAPRSAPPPPPPGSPPGEPQWVWQPARLEGLNIPTAAELGLVAIPSSTNDADALPLFAGTPTMTGEWAERERRAQETTGQMADRLLGAGGDEDGEAQGGPKAAETAAQSGPSKSSVPSAGFTFQVPSASSSSTGGKR